MYYVDYADMMIVPIVELTFLFQSLLELLENGKRRGRKRDGGRERGSEMNLLKRHGAHFSSSG